MQQVRTGLNQALCAELSFTLHREVKFGALFDRLVSKDSWLATGECGTILTRETLNHQYFTGHYADKRWTLPSPTLRNLFAYSKFPSRPQLRRPADRSKDQPYYLSAIPEASLARTLFPLAPYKKTEVREMAQKWQLPTAAREESMGICFVGEKRRFDDFICVPHGCDSSVVRCAKLLPLNSTVHPP